MKNCNIIVITILQLQNEYYIKKKTRKNNKLYITLQIKTRIQLYKNEQ